MMASELLTLATDGEARPGPNRCYFCGSSCGGLYARNDYLRDTFTDFDSVVCPASQFVCRGCVLSFREKLEMPGREKQQKTRNYSWVITHQTATPYTKADTAALRAICLVPPPPPYAIAIATSGQKHVIFKTPACVTNDRAIVCLEGEVIDYAPQKLADRIELVSRIVVVCGKPSMADAPKISMAMRLHESFGDAGTKDFERWSSMWTLPLSRLSVFLSPSMKELQS